MASLSLCTVLITFVYQEPNGASEWFFGHPSVLRLQLKHASCSDSPPQVTDTPAGCCRAGNTLRWLVRVLKYSTHLSTNFPSRRDRVTFRVRAKLKLWEGLTLSPVNHRCLWAGVYGIRRTAQVLHCTSLCLEISKSNFRKSTDDQSLAHDRMTSLWAW